jgi:DNA-binding MarR family transcriptional regulator
MQRQQLLNFLFELFLDLPRINRFIDGSDSYGLSTFEIGLLLEISATPNLSVKDFHKFYSPDRTLLDRSVLELANLKFIKLTKSSVDKRERCITITPHGVNAIRKLDDLFNGIISRFKQYGSDKQLNRVVDFFKLIADNLDQKQRPPRKGEHLYRSQQRRITRALKLHDRKWFGGDLNSQSIQILALLNLEVDEQTPTELGETFNIPTPLLQLTLRVLYEKGLISLTVHANDKRKKVVSITSRGKQVFSDTERNAFNLLSTATSKLSDKQLKDYILDFNFFLRGYHQLYELKLQILPASEKISFKKWALKLLVANNSEQDLPTRFLSDFDNIAMFYIKDKPVGFAQFEVIRLSNSKANEKYNKEVHISVNFIDKKYLSYSKELHALLKWKISKLYSKSLVIFSSK